MQVFKLLDLHLILFLGFGKNCIPMSIELLVLLNVSLLDFFLALLVNEDHLLIFHVELLLLEFKNAVLGKLSLYTKRVKFS